MQAKRKGWEVFRVVGPGAGLSGRGSLWGGRSSGEGKVNRIGSEGTEVMLARGIFTVPKNFKGENPCRGGASNGVVRCLRRSDESWRGGNLIARGLTRLVASKRMNLGWAVGKIEAWGR